MNCGKEKKLSGNENRKKQKICVEEELRHGTCKMGK
jgi:hypothetical protein